MLSNENNFVSYNSFLETSKIPYQIIEFLILSESQSANNLFKLLRYTEYDALDKPNLTFKEKKDLIWTPKSKDWEMEENFNIFLKRYMFNSTNTANEQTQMRIFQYNNTPTTRINAVLTYQFDFFTNDKTSIVYYDGIMCARLDLLEVFLLDCLNGADIGIGQNYLRFDRELSRSCQSMSGLSNSKTFWGKSVVLAMNYTNVDTGGGC